MWSSRLREKKYTARNKLLGDGAADEFPETEEEEIIGGIERQTTSVRKRKEEKERKKRSFSKFSKSIFGKGCLKGWKLLFTKWGEEERGGSLEDLVASVFQVTSSWRLK